MILAGLLLAAAMPPPAGTLTLDADDPVLDVTIAGVPMRLRVDLDGRDAVELNPDAAARLPLRWHEGFPAQVGAVELPGRAAQAPVRIAGRNVPLNISHHGRPCCAGVDGSISPALLPYAEVHFVRAGGGGQSARFPLRRDEDGLWVADGPLAVQLSLARDVSVASKAAGVLLAEHHGGGWSGRYVMRAEAFGVPRPVRPLTLARPATILGRPVGAILVRSDYGGGRAMPEERPRPDDIVVRRGGGGRDWPLVSMGRDLLAACARIVYRSRPPSLELVCP